jgi:hypothetical protein
MYIVLLMKCNIIMSLFTPITWDRFFKKEMAKADGFEPRIFQL